MTDEHRGDLEQFRAFLRNLIMHGAVGTALGGVCTLVGEPQNLLIAEKAGWDFMTFFWTMAPVTMPVLVCGLITCLVIEKTAIVGYGVQLPSNVRNVLVEYSEYEQSHRTNNDVAALIVQGIVCLLYTSPSPRDIGPSRMPSSA